MRVWLRAAPLVLLALTGCGRDAETLPGPGLTGVLLDEGGAPLPWVSVMACRADLCFYGDSGADGRFTFLLDRPGDLLIKTAEDLDSDPRRATPMVPVRITGDEFLDIGAVYAPSLPKGMSPEMGVSGAGRLELGEGLTLVVDPEALDLSPGDRLTDVSARRLPEGAIPSYPDLHDEEILAVYALHPFAAESPEPVALSVASDLATGVSVRFRTIDPTDGSFSDPVFGVATGDALVSEPGQGIRTLTHLIVTVASPGPG